jgi:hypothetical protein
MQGTNHLARGLRRALKALEAGSAALSATIVLLCCLMIPFARVAEAQTAGSGSIQGSVTDSSGALIPNASVKLVEASTQVTLTTKTSSGGDYAFPNINVGTYSVTIAAPGFQTYTSTGNVLEVGSSIAINAKMTVGKTDVVVEVRTESLALQTEDPSFKQTVDATEMTELPLNGRTIEGLVSLVGGTQNSSPGDSNGSKFTTQSGGISIAGAQGNAVTWRLDGGDNTDYMGGNNGPFPFPDALGQFSVETAALGAQGGNEAGGLVNAVTKSGTNTYHGAAFEFIRNNIINATNFFSTSKDTLHQHQYGGTFGGPLWIPKLIDTRDKLFFFVSFQHSQTHSASATNNAYIPTAANLAGDFSTTSPAPAASGGTGVKNACGNPVVQLYDPITQQLLPGNKYNNAFGAFPAVPLPTYNAAALATLKQFPAIDPALDPNNCGHISYAIPNINSDNEFDTRVDYTINQKHNIYFRYFLDSNQIPSFYSPTNIFLTTQSGNPEIRWQNLTIGENWTIRSNLVNTVHLTGIRRQLSRGFNAATPNHNAFGIKDFQAVPSGVYVNIGTSGANLGHSFGGGSNLLAIVDDNVPIDIADDVTWILGRHQIAFGGAFVRNQLNLNNGFQSNGDFTFNGMWSSKGGVGNANLDFLEGAMSSFSQTLPQTNALRGSIPTAYAQDTFHATPRLTLTAGIRWQPLYFPNDLHNHGSTFNMAAFVANQHSSVYPNAPAGSYFYGDPGVSPNFTTNTPLAFNPNFGVAYDASGNGKTVFRVGAAYAYDQPNFFVQQRVQQNPPYSVTISPNSNSQLCYSDPWLIGGTGNLGCGQTGGTDVDPFPFDPKNFVFPQQNQVIVLTNHYQMPDTLQWTASVQQQLPHGWTAQIFYTGNRTQHQLASIPLSQDSYIPGVWGAGNTGCGPIATSGPAFTAVYGAGVPAVGSPCSVNGTNSGLGKQNQLIRAALTEANPAQGNYYNEAHNGNPSLTEVNNASGNYNGVEVTVQHRLSSTFNLETNYTWSKCLNDADPQGDISGGQYSNPNNPGLDYGPCGSDIRHNFNVLLVLKSKFAVHGVTGYLINNWQFAPVTRLVSGTPFNVTEGQDESFTGDGGDRPNLVPGVPIYNYTKIKSDHAGAVYADRSYLNQAAFTLNLVPGTQGAIRRNSFRNPIYFQDDAEISRIFPIREKYNIDLRIEAYNVLNHPSFSSGNNGGPSFSGNFGEITGTSVGGRVFQGAVKLSF